MDAILIAGPTASGKSALALHLAREHGGVVVNADAMQVYEPLRIVSARPSEADVALVDHRLYGHVPGDVVYSTGRWYRDVAEVLHKARQKGCLPVIVGGTGLYFRALLGGLSEMPAVPAETRAYWRTQLDAFGPADLHARLAEVDGETARRLARSDRQRIVRALEVFHATGRSIRTYQDVGGVPLIEGDRSRRILVLPDRDVVWRRIAERTASMMKSGGIEEVAALLARRIDDRYPVMKAIGVREIVAHISGKLSRQEAEDQLVMQTRRYAKRQITWFRNQLDENWEIVAGDEKYTYL